MTSIDHAYGGIYRGAAVLVTGGAGFIGSHLARRLAELGAEVRVIDDLSTGHAENLPPEGVDLIEASILDDHALAGAMDGCRFVFHQAAMVSVPQSVRQPAKCAAVNIGGTERVLEAAEGAGVERVIFASSAAVYGDEPRLPSTETDPIDCRSPYAASKAAGEALLSAFGRCYDLSTVSLRYFNIFGERQDPNSPYAAVIAAFGDALRSGRAPVIFGDGRQTRDFTYVANAVHANLLAGACSKPLAGEAINIGTGRRTSLLEVLKLMAEALGAEPSPVFEAPRPGDIMHSVADVARAGELMGYRPTENLAAGLKRLVSWARADHSDMSGADQSFGGGSSRPS